MELKDWQEHVSGRAGSESTNIMVVAERNEGKTTLLTKLEEETGAPLLDGRTISGDEVIDAANDEESLILMDEGGAFRHARQLAEAIENNPNTQFIIGTQPTCPSMGMVKGYFDVVNASEFSPDE